MPPEIGEGHKKRAARRGMRLLMLLVAVVVLLASGGAFYLQIQAESARQKAEGDALVLLSKQAAHSEIRSVISGIAEGKAAVAVGGATDIVWSDYIRQLQSLLPADVTLTNVSVDQAGVMEAYPQSDVPLERPRIAEIKFTAETSVLPSIPSWIDALSGLPGFADATPTSLAFAQNVYSAEIVMHIDTGAYSNRFVPPADSDTEGTD